MQHASNPPRGSAFRYLDFELEILPGRGRDYPVRVINSPEGQARATMRFPFDEPALELHLGDLRAALRSSADERRHLVPPGEESEQDRVRSFGQRLFDALFSGEVRDNYYLSRQKAAREHSGLRLKLRIEAPELATVPWEFLYDPREPDYVCLSVDTPLVRYLPIPKTVRPLAVQPPLRVLGMIACPRDLPALDTEREKRRLEEAVEALQARGLIELVWLAGQTSRDLMRTMRGRPWHVFHFIGHGGFDPQAGQGFIALADEEGNSDRLRAVSLGRLLADQESLRLAVLNSCEGAKGSERDVLSSTAAALVRRGIPAVLAMQHEISDAAAIQLARSFYEGLVEGMPVDAAVAEARKMVSVAEDTVEWGTPVLFMRGEGRLFELSGAPERELQEEGPPVIDEALEQRLHQLYLDGREAALLENWEKAYRKFREVVGLRADYRDAADQLEQAKAQRRWHRWYEEAQAAQEVGDWDTAAKTLKKLVKEAPDFQAVAAVLQKVERRKRLADLYEEARQFAAMQKWQAVIKALERIRELDADYPDPDGLLSMASERVKALERQRRAEGLYEQGLERFEAEGWSDAAKAFEQIQQLEPGYRESKALLAQARDRLQAGKREHELEQLYQRAGEALEGKDWPAAIQALEELIAEAPEYRDAADLLQAAKVQKQLAELYAEARRLHRTGQWQGVVDAFEKIKAIDARCPDPEGLLVDARRRLAEPARGKAASGVPRWPLVAGAALIVGIIILVGERLNGGGKATPVPQPTRTGTAMAAVVAGISPTHTGTPTRTHTPTPTSTPVPTRTEVPTKMPTLAALSFVPPGARARLGKGTVEGIALPPGGEYLAVGSSVGLYLYDADTLRGVWLAVSDSWLTSVAFHPDGSLLASGSRGGTVMLWDAQTGQPLRILEGHTDEARSVAFHPDGSTLASGSGDGTVILWDVQTGQLLHTLEGHTKAVSSVAFHPDGSTLASGSGDGTVTLWDAQTGQRLHTLQGHSGGVWSVTFRPDGSTLASGSSDRTVMLWDAQTGQHLRTLEGHTSMVLSVAFHPDGSTLVSGSYDRTVMLWDAQTGQHLRTLNGYSAVYCVAFHPDGSVLASKPYDGTVVQWDAQSGQRLHTLQGHTTHVYTVAFHPDGSTIASGLYDKVVMLWDVQTGQQLRTLEGHATDVWSVAFQPDGLILASGSQGGRVMLWDSQTGQLLRTMEHRQLYNVHSVAFHPDGSTLASGSYDGAVMLWDVQTGQLLRTLEGHTGGATSVAFHPDGSTLASGSGDGMVMLWDVQTGQRLRSLEGHTERVSSVAFHPVGTMLASGSLDGTVVLWDAQTGQHLRSLEGHMGGARSVAFHPDGSTLASGSDDGTVMLWDVQTGQRLRTLKGHTSRVNSVAFHPDGSTLASGSDDGTVMLWNITP